MRHCLQPAHVRVLPKDVLVVQPGGHKVWHFAHVDEDLEQPRRQLDPVVVQDGPRALPQLLHHVDDAGSHQHAGNDSPVCEPSTVAQPLPHLDHKTTHGCMSVTHTLQRETEGERGRQSRVLHSTPVSARSQLWPSLPPRHPRPRCRCHSATPR